MTRMLGQSPAFAAARSRLAKFAACDEPILIEGETGTGKELAARAVHYTSPRQDQPFVPVNCGSIPDGLVENELFGHARGSFTDAKTDHCGVIGLAEGGTLFLDEIDTLSAKAQVVLLRFLQDHIYRPLGAHAERVADVRIVAATNASLAEIAEKGSFRSDLLFRLRVLHVRLPPLRERSEDVAALSRHFLAQCAERLHRPAKTLHPGLLERMLAYPWPGNVRELESIIWRAFLLEDGPVITADALPEFAGSGEHSDDKVSARAFSEAKAAAISAFEVRYLADVMSRAGGNVTAAAKLAGTERRYLGRLLKKHGLDRKGLSAA